MWASENASSNKNGINMVETLLKFGASVDQVDFHGLTAFDRLCMTSGNVRAAQILIKAGSHLHSIPNHKHPMTHLMIAAMNGHKELCRELMMYMDPRLKNSHGFTALQYAESFGHIGLARIIEDRIRYTNEEK